MKTFIKWGLFAGALSLLFTLTCCKEKSNASVQITSERSAAFEWDNANIYFMLTDRFNNGNPDNDMIIPRKEGAGKMRDFQGGDISGITQKVKDNYFSDLGVNALWFTPIFEQNRGATNEGAGATYAFHGYWIKDWTNIDPNFGNTEDLHNLVAEAHAKGIRVLLDVVINHTGPVTEQDPVWPEEWVRTEPQCTYETYESTVTCTLVENLPDIRTESNEEVELPQGLLDKWKSEGRLEKELAELDDFFARTGHPRAPRFYIIKWLTDYIREFGVDGFRVDTVKHTEEQVWSELRDEADIAFADWKKAHPDKVMDDNGFYMLGEVYNYNVHSGHNFDNSGTNVDYYAHGFNSLISFGLNHDTKNKSYEEIFSAYRNSLDQKLQGYNVVNYVSSHDDGAPYDSLRQHPYRAANSLLLTPGAAQIYYGDESSRTLVIDGTDGDVNLRSNMNWDQLDQNTTVSGHKVKDVLRHWQQLGKFKSYHPAVGMGAHNMINESPYTFSRVHENDRVVIALDLQDGNKSISVGDVFENGSTVSDYYSGTSARVKDGMVSFDTPYSVLLLEQL